MKPIFLSDTRFKFSWLFIGMLIPMLFAFNSWRESQCMAIMLKKQNIIFAGVENPMSIAVHDIPSEQIKVTAKGFTITNNGNGKYTATAKTAGIGTILVETNGFSEEFEIRIKKIPDPVPRLGPRVFNNNMIIDKCWGVPVNGIAAILENFDFEAKCEIVSYSVTYIAPKQDPVQYTNKGARFSSDVQSLIDKAKPGDSYFFDEIKAKCPGDENPREIGTMIFKIK
jgi:GldM C-terminal domain